MAYLHLYKNNPSASVAGARTYTITTNAVAADTFTVAGVTLTAVASGATTTQFNVGADVAATAVNVAAKLNANTTITAKYTATANSGAITLTEKYAGLGNTPGEATTTGTMAVTNGAATTSTAATDGTEVTEGTGTARITFGPLNATDNEVSAVLTLAIRAEAGYITGAVTTITPSGTHAAKLALSADNVTWGAYGAALTLAAGIGAANKLFYIKAKATDDETPQNDTALGLAVYCATVNAA